MLTSKGMKILSDSLWHHLYMYFIRSLPWLYHSFVKPRCSFVTCDLKVARKHTSQPDYLRMFSQLVHELAGRLTVQHFNQIAVNYYFNNPQYPNIYIFLFSSLFLLHITFKMTCYIWDHSQCFITYTQTFMSWKCTKPASYEICN